MRLTTKITLGIILSIFVISLIFIISLSVIDGENRSNVNVIELPQDNKTGIELSAFKTIIIDEGTSGLQENFSYNLISDFRPILEKNSPDMLYIPEVLKDYVSVNTLKDTLTIKLYLNDLGKKYKNEKYRIQHISEINLHFNVSEMDIINKMKNSSINIKNIETDSIKIDSYGNIFIDSCKVQFIEPNVRKRVTITNCDIKRINLDLDYLQQWSIEKCNIEETYYTGSKKHNLTLHDNSGIKYWIPKNKDAKLVMTLQGNPAKINFP